MKILISILKIIIILIIITSCDSADSNLGVNSTFINDDDNDNGDNDGSSGDNGGGAAPNYYANITEAMADGVIGYWKMDETSEDTSVDETGTQNGTSSNTTILDGKTGFGKCRSYNGTSSWTNITGFTSTAQSYTFGFWMYIVATTDCYYFDSGTGRFLLGIRSNTLQVYNSTDNWQNYGYTPTTGTWIFVVNVLDNTTGKANLYVNNQHVGVEVNWTGKDIGSTTRIGSRYLGGSQFYNGYLDDLAIWNRALSASEIAAIYNSNAPLIP